MEASFLRRFHVSLQKRPVLMLPEIQEKFNKALYLLWRSTPKQAMRQPWTG